MPRTGWLALATVAALAILPATGIAGSGAGRQAQLTVLAPEQGAVVTENTVATRVKVSGFRIDGRLAGRPPQAGVGHYHIHLDGALVNAFAADTASISLQNIAPGRHTLTFALAGNDHMELAGTARRVTFTHRPTRPLPRLKPVAFAGKPAIRILSPGAGATVRGSVAVTVSVQNLRLSSALFGKAPLAGYGHWHVFLDSPSLATMMGMFATRTARVPLAGVAPGRHRILAVLADNQHAPIAGAMAAVTVTVRR